MTTEIHRHAMVGLASLIALAIPAGAYAQSVETDSAGQPAGMQDSSAANADIVVTARRVAERLQDVPLAISAVNGATLQRQGITELRNLDAAFPNVQVGAANAGGSAVVLTIRGQSQSNTGILFVDGAVGVYVDGLGLARNYGLRSGLLDVQRVEVLRGPQGTLYGRNTTGGAISIVTNDPDDSLGGSIQGSYGNYSAFNIQSVLNVPLAEGLNARFVVQHNEHDPYAREAGSGRGLADEDNTYVRAKLKAEYGGFRATLTGDYFRYRSLGPSAHLVGLTPASADTRFSGRVANVPGAVTPTAANPTGTGTYLVAGGTLAREVQSYLGLPFTPAGLNAASAMLAQYVRRGPNAAAGVGFYDSFLGYPGQGSNSKGGSAVLNAELDLTDNIMARSISGWRYYNRYDGADQDQTPFPAFEAAQRTPYDNFYSEEFQLLGNGRRYKWVAGAYYSYERGLDLTYSYPANHIGLVAGAPLNATITDAISRNISRAVFAQGSYEIVDDLTLTLGGRLTKETKKLDNRNRQAVRGCMIPASLRADPAICLAKFDNSFSKPAFLASLDYKVTSNTLAYVKLSRGFRGGGQQGRANSADINTYTPYAPETVTEYEVGIKTDLFDRRLRINLAAFYDDFRDIQRSVTLLVGTASTTRVNNAAKARLYGVEGEINLRVVDGFSVGGTFGYLNAKYLKFDDVLLGDRSGEAWPAPRWTYALNARYETPISVGSFNASANWNYRSKQDFQPQAVLANQVTQKGYGLLEATAGISFDALELDVALFGRNILQQHYYTSGISLESAGFNILYTGEPRTYGIRLTKKFGA